MTTARPATDAASAAQLDGAGWLSNLLDKGIAGYTAVETVRNQRRALGATVTQDPPRVESPGAVGGISARTWMIGGAVVVLALVLGLVVSRRS